MAPPMHSRSSCLHNAKHTDDAANQTEGCAVGPFNFNWVEFRVLRLERDATVCSVEALHGSLVLDKSHHNIAIRSGLLGMNKNVVTIQNVGAFHASALNFQKERPGRSPTLG